MQLIFWQPVLSVRLSILILQTHFPALGSMVACDAPAADRTGFGVEARLHHKTDLDSE
jgi:hypothetical protein